MVRIRPPSPAETAGHPDSGRSYAERSNSRTPRNALGYESYGGQNGVAVSGSDANAGRRGNTPRLGLRGQLLGSVSLLAGAGLGGAGLVLSLTEAQMAAGFCFAASGLASLFGIWGAITALSEKHVAATPAASQTGAAGTIADADLDRTLGRALRRMGLAITVFDPNGKLRLADDSSLALLAQPDAEPLLGKSVADLARFGFRSGTILTAQQMGEDAWVARRVEAFENPGDPLDMQMHDGSWRRLIEYRSPDGWTFGIRSDVTELHTREAAAKAREEAEIRLNDAVETIEVNLMLFDSGGNLLLANSAAKDSYSALGNLFGPGMSFGDWMDALPRNDLAREAEGRVDEWSNDLDWAFTQADGSRLPRRIGDRRFEFHAHRSSDGSVLVMENDLTEALLREEELERQTALLRATLDNTPQAIAVYDSQVRLIAWNRRFEALLNLPSRLARAGTPLQEIMEYCLQTGVLLAPQPDALIAERLKAYEAPDGSNHVLHFGDGREVEVRLHTAGEGRVVSTLTDMTQERRRAAEMLRAKEAAEMANRAKSQFLANVTHELRTPLNAIIGFAEVLRDELFGPLGVSQYKDFVIDIHDSGTHLLALINDILDYAKTESGQRDLSIQPFDLHSAAAAAIRMVAPRATEKDIGLTTAFPEKPLVLLGDERAFRQILLNLLSNAVKFTPRGGSVDLTASISPSGGADIRVADTGIGIAAVDIPRALAPFVQVDSDLSREFEGTGLGLPLAKNLVTLHGGDLQIESEVGRGTTIVIQLPHDRVVQAPSPA